MLHFFQLFPPYAYLSHINLPTRNRDTRSGFSRVLVRQSTLEN